MIGYIPQIYVGQWKVRSIKNTSNSRFVEQWKGRAIVKTKISNCVRMVCFWYSRHRVRSGQTHKRCVETEVCRMNEKVDKSAIFLNKDMS